MLAMCQEGKYISGSYLPIISLFYVSMATNIPKNTHIIYIKEIMKILSFVCKRRFVAIIDTTAVMIV